MAKIAIIGSGVVGTATGKGLLAWGHEVIFSDNNPLVLEKLRMEGLSVCGYGECLLNQNGYVMTISTPTVDGEIKLDFLKSATANLGEILRQRSDYSVVVVRSTVPPGTTRQDLVPILERFSGKKAGTDFGVAMNPEFLREKSATEDFAHPRLILAGMLDEKSREFMEEIYQVVEVPKFFTSIEEAEMEKYIHNLWNAVKISFFNEMREVCEELELNSDKIFALVTQSAEASWNPWYGTRDMGPFGGTCLPKDTQAFLAWTREKLNMKLLVLEATIRVNERLKNK